jgi:hypothetical protein
MSNNGKVHCEDHGETQQTFVCEHLTGDSVGLGFNANPPIDEDPFPDAWCDNCELIFQANNGWTPETEKLCNIKLLCAGCYTRARIRNTRTTSSLADLDDFRWKCASCEEWHTGACLDFGADFPYSWSEEHEKENKKLRLFPNWGKKKRPTYLEEEYCVIEERDFFIRGNIHLPIIGTSETFRWGAWGSLSRDNFDKVVKMNDDPKRTELEPMFSWLNSYLPGYPDTVSLKMNVHIRPIGERPQFELEHTKHPLAEEYHHGITVERVKEIMIAQLPATSDS